MHTVKSKYKNPDRMIATLKTQLGFAETRVTNRQLEIETLRKENEQIKRSFVGNHWFDYSKGVTKGVSFNDLSTSKRANLNDTVWLKGSIIKIIHSLTAKESKATFEIESVYLKK